MPCSGELEVEELDAELAGVPHQRGELPRGELVGDRKVPVAGGDVVVHRRQVSSGRRTRRPASRSPSNAWGEVTSCTRCRST